MSIPEKPRGSQPILKSPVYMAQAVFGFDEQLEPVSEIDVVVVRCFRRVLSLDAVCSLYFCCCDPSPFLWFGLFGSSTSAARRSGIGSLGIRGVARFID